MKCIERAASAQRTFINSERVTLLLLVYYVMWGVEEAARNGVERILHSIDSFRAGSNGMTSWLVYLTGCAV